MSKVTVICFLAMSSLILTVQARHRRSTSTTISSSSIGNESTPLSGSSSVSYGNETKLGVTPSSSPAAIDSAVSPSGIAANSSSSVAVNSSVSPAVNSSVIPAVNSSVIPAVNSSVIPAVNASVISPSSPANESAAGVLVSANHL